MRLDSNIRPRVAARLGLFVALLLCGATASADWLQYRHGIDRNAVVNAALDAPVDRITYVTTPDEVRATPTIVDGDLLVGNHLSGTLQRIDPATGALRWQLSAPNWIHSEIVWAGHIGVVGYGNRYFPGDADSRETNFVRGTGESGVMAVDLDDGTLLWRYRTTGEVMPTPAIRGDDVFVAGGDRAVHVLSLANGRQRGLVSLGSFVSMSSPAVDDAGLLFVGGGNPYRFFAVDTAKRRLLWQHDFDDVIAGMDDVPPAIGDHTAITSAVRATADPARFEHRLYALDTRDGALRWQASLGTGPEVKNNRSGAPAIAGNRVVVGSPTSGTLQAFALDSGERLWRVDSGPMKAPPAIADGRVYATNLAGELLVVDLADGRLRRRLKLSDAPLAPAGPVLTAHHLVVPSQDHRVYLVPRALLESD